MIEGFMGLNFQVLNFQDLNFCVSDSLASISCWLPSLSCSTMGSRTTMRFQPTGTVTVRGWNLARWNCSFTAPPPFTSRSNLRVSKVFKITWKMRNVLKRMKNQIFDFYFSSYAHFCTQNIFSWEKAIYTNRSNLQVSNIMIWLNIYHQIAPASFEV